MANDPGWYADPWRPGRRRWWDGNDWTDHTYDPDAPVPQPSAMQPLETPRPTTPPPQAPWQQEWRPVTQWQPINPAALAQREIADERSLAKWARWGFIASAAVSVIGAIITIATLSDVVDSFRDLFDGTSSSTGSASVSFGGYSSLGPLGFVPLAAIIINMIWSHRAMTVARNLRYPSTYSVGWSVAGWLVPILSFWFPYVTVRDLLPEGHPMRVVVKRWWAFHLVASLLGFVALATAFASIPAGAILYGVGACSSVLAANLAVHLVDAILEDHTAAVQRVTGAG